MRQRVPMTSAVRVGGERLYSKAHRGETVETPERDVEVYRAELLGRAAMALPTYEIECSRRYLRADPDRDARGRLLLGPAPHRGRPVRGSRKPARN